MTDPFCAHAQNGKYMDLASTRSVSFTTHTRGPIGTNAAGIGSSIIYPNYMYDQMYPATMTGTSASFLNSLVPNANPTVTSYRIVSMGVVIRSVAAPLNASGMVRIRGFGTTSGVTLGTVDIGTYNADYSYDIPLQACVDTAVVLRKLDSSAMLFKAPSSSFTGAGINTWASPGIGAVVISIEGGPASSSSILDVEILTHYEVQFSDSDPLQQIATPAPKYSLAVTTATQTIGSTAETIFTNGVKQAGAYFERMAEQALTALIMP